MSITVQVEATDGSEWPVEYRWDRDTGILTASSAAPAVGDGVSGSVEITGADGSWLILDLASGSIRGVEVAVWPDIRTVRTLNPPNEVRAGRLTIPHAEPNERVASFEVPALLIAETDVAERTVHFRVGRAKARQTVRIARDILIEVDAADAIAGVWLLNVPPHPDDS